MNGSVNLRGILLGAALIVCTLILSSKGSAAPVAGPTGTVSVWVYGPGAGLRLPVSVELVSQAYHRQLTLTRSNTSAPGCAAAANTFTDVPPGFYDWISTTGQSPPMQGRLQVIAGRCTSQQVTVNGSTNATGSVMFWAQAGQRALLTPAPAVTLTGATPTTRYVTAAYTSQPPCNEPGGALYANLPPGSYRFVTSGGVSPASGVVNIIPGACVTQALAVTTPGILATGPVQGGGFVGSMGSPSGTTSTTSSGSPHGTTNSTTSSTSSTTSSSSTSGPPAGTTTSGATGESTTSTMRGNLPGRTPGSCASMNDYVSVVSNVTGTVCGNANSRSITVRNNSGVILDIRVGLERTDGTYNCGASLQVLPGATFTQYSCTSTGRYFIQSMKYDDWLAGCRMGDQGCR